MDFRHKPEKMKGYTIERVLTNLPELLRTSYEARGLIAINDSNEPRIDRVTCNRCGSVFWGGNKYEEHLGNSCRANLLDDGGPE